MFKHIFIILYIHSFKVLLGAVYLAPNIQPLIYNSHASTVEHLISIYSPSSVLLCGDYNIPNVDWNHENLGLIATGLRSLTSLIIWWPIGFNIF